jgi:hypothetical protein
LQSPIHNSLPNLFQVAPSMVKALKNVAACVRISCAEFDHR